MIKLVFFKGYVECKNNNRREGGELGLGSQWQNWDLVKLLRAGTKSSTFPESHKIYSLCK